MQASRQKALFSHFLKIGVDNPSIMMYIIKRREKLDANGV